jgi:HlyD family secretion protein/macrolide-specific efflux system membrane fusion protein
MKRRIVWINVGLAVLVVAAAVGAYFWFFAPKTETASGGRTVAVQSGAVSETVTATGTVGTAGSLDLSFSTSGTVTKVNVADGDKVKKGQRLVLLDDASANQALVSARSSYVQAVNGQQQGAVSTKQAQQSVTQADKSVTDAQTNARLNKASYQQSIDTAHANVATAKSTWSDACLDPNGVCPNSDAWAQLRAAEAELTSAKTAYDQAVQTASGNETTNNIKLNQAQTDLAAAEAKQNNDCNTYGSSSQQCSSAVEAVRSGQQQLELAQNSQASAATQSQQTLVNADAKVTQANINLKKLQASLAKAAKDGLTSAREALQSAELNQKKGLEADRQAIVKAQQSLKSAQLSAQATAVGSGSTATTQAQIAVAKAGLDFAQRTVDETVLVAPTSGRIASVTVTKGSAAQAGTTVATLLPKGQYEVAADFAEADALKVRVGQKATVTFDALADTTATGVVTSIDTLPTAGQNVTTYGVTVTLDSTPTGLKQGMSASVVVTANEADNVLWVPTAAITTAGGRSTVTVRKDGKDTTVEVTTGLAGDSGTEITSGVAEGDQLVVATTASGGNSGFPFGGIPGEFGGGTRVRGGAGGPG